MTYIKCNNCGNEENLEDAKFCVKCGEPLDPHENSSDGNDAPEKPLKWPIILLIALLLIGAAIGAYFGFRNKIVPDKVEIIAKSSDSVRGTVTGGGDYVRFDTVTLVAKANEGYLFVSWTDGSTDSIRKVVADQDKEYLANFDSNYRGGDSHVEKTTNPIYDTQVPQKPPHQPNPNPNPKPGLNPVVTQDANRPADMNNEKFDTITIIFPYGKYIGGYKVVNGKPYPSGWGMMKFYQRVAFPFKGTRWHYRYVKAGYELVGKWDGETVRCGKLFDGSDEGIVLDSVPCNTCNNP